MRVGHMCELDDYKDSLREYIPGHSLLARVGRFCVGLTLIHPDISKIYIHHLESRHAINTERLKQITLYSIRIHPYSIARILWVTYLFILMLLQIFMVPLGCVFYTMLYKNEDFFEWKKKRLVLDFLCCINIFVTSITGYYDESSQLVELHFKKIFMNYAKTRLIFDIFIAIPIDWDEIFPDLNEETLFYLYVLAVFKCLCLFSWFSYLKTICDYWKMSYYKYLLLSAFLVTTAFYHTVCCLNRYFKLIYTRYLYLFEKDKFKEINEVYYFPTICEVYIDLLYHGAYIVYNAGYGKHRPIYDIDYVVIVILWYTCTLFCIYVLALLLQMIKGRSSSKFKYAIMEKQLNYYMQQKQFPSELQDRILKYYHFRFHNRYFKEHEIMSTLSEQLRQELTMQSCKKLVESVVFFSGLPLKVLIKIISCLKKEIYLVNDVIIKANTPARSMYFISIGTVAIYTKSGKEICHLDDGDYFGEVGIIIKDAQRVATVIAVEITETYRLDQKDFVKAITPYPDLVQEIKQIATDRMEIASMIDENRVPGESMSKSNYALGTK